MSNHQALAAVFQVSVEHRMVRSHRYAWVSALDGALPSVVRSVRVARHYPDSKGYGFRAFRAYVPVARRARYAAVEIEKLRKQGRSVDPVAIERNGRAVARTFWGQAWCTNLEAYSDFSNRLPRGRTYVRNGSVIDLQVGAGRVTALVQGSDLYEIAIDVKSLAKKRWAVIVADCAGGVGSLVELLRGKVSERVMRVVTRPATGLFPAPTEITMSCSCPDWAVMCKHVAAALYGIGARLDDRPELLFTLRGVDPADLVSEAAAGGGIAGRAAPKSALAESDLSSLFGVEIEEAPATPAPKRRSKTGLALPARRTEEHAARRRRRVPDPKSTNAGAREPSLEARLVALVMEQPGLRVEQIGHQIATSTKNLMLPLRKLLAEGRIRTRGVKRATRYFPARTSS